jgi:lipopolysaccharide/colanic/teichoic acid biosynthesis glycosyltransferase
MSVKRFIDLTVSAAALIALSPMLVLIAAAVRCTSRGPAIFRQRRLGQNGRPFYLCKFRSMYSGCADMRNADGSAYTADQDLRVTPFGRFLRRASIDELPQLWNVMRGDMSLVGPRPDQVDQLRYYRPEERRKLAVKPGLTGLAQISGRNSISWERRKLLDVEYVEHASLSLDLSILCKTIPYVLLRRDINAGCVLEKES